MTNPVDRPPGTGSDADDRLLDASADPVTTDPLGEPSLDDPDSDKSPPGSPRPQLKPFSLEGRRAPGLYLFGWLAIVLGGPTMVATYLSSSGGLVRLALFVFGALLFGLGLTAAAGTQAIERRGRAGLAYAGPSPFLVFGASIPLTILVELPFLLADVDVRSPLVILLSVALTGAVSLILLGTTVVGTGALSWPEIAIGIAAGGARRIGGDLLVGAAAAPPVIVATAIVGAILIRLTGVSPEGPIPAPTDAAGAVILFIAAAIVAPLCEELFYRGFATTVWLRSYGVRRAIVQGALFFAFAHILTVSGADFEHAAKAALVAFGGRIPVALTLGWLFVERRSLAASIGLHATFNGILVVLSALTVNAVPG